MLLNIVLTLVAVLVYITAIFAIAWNKKRLDIVDIAWGGGFIIAALTSLVMGKKGILQLLVTSLVVIWAVRLGIYIFKRVRHSKAEDPRYVDMRKTWKGNAAVQAYVRIFVVQGILATIVSGSVIVVNLSREVSVGWGAGVGAAVWFVGFLFESIGDSQLRKHLANPANKGSLMTSGLWRYTRHPNYFGETVQWWGIFMIALGVPLGWIGVISPLTITGLVLFVSGVPLTEKRFEGRPGWSEYKKGTSVFIPWFPNKHK